MDLNRHAGFRFCLDVLISILGLSHCCILYLLKASGTLHLSNCQTKANQRHLFAVTSPDLDLQPHYHLGSPGSDPVGRKNKTFETYILPPLPP
jgi:hypothetical protein